MFFKRKKEESGILLKLKELGEKFKELKSKQAAQKKEIHKKLAMHDAVLSPFPVDWDLLRSKVPGSNPAISPNLLADLLPISMNLKTFGYQLGAQLVNTVLAKVKYDTEPQHYGFPSKPTTQNDVESPWFAYWCKEIHSAPIYHRKMWEFAYVLQALWEEGILNGGKQALGFGCGMEPLPSYFAAKGMHVIATDLAPEESEGKGWTTTNQHASSLKAIHNPALCSEETFLRQTRLEYVDMNAIPDSYHGRFDLVWSICALEHLGSIELGLKFIEESVKCLAPGGVALHTTEFNFLSDDKTVDHFPTVLFRKRDFEEIAGRLRAQGYEITLNFDTGTGVLDRFIDLPPYSPETDIFLRPDDPANMFAVAHLKLSLNGFPSTCYALRIKKPL